MYYVLLTFTEAAQLLLLTLYNDYCTLTKNFMFIRQREAPFGFIRGFSGPRMCNFVKIAGN